MRNKLVTPFWKNALASLPADLRLRYEPDIVAAERLELRLDALVKLWSGLKARVSGRRLHTA